MQIPPTQSTVTSALFGKTPNGEAVFLHQLTNKNGMQVQVMEYGATLKSVKYPLNDQTLIDVVLGFDTLEHYIQSYELPSAPYLGATVGRYAGRINKGAFTLDGQQIELSKNNNGHCLHGGNVGFSQRVWRLINKGDGENPFVTFALFSPDLDEGFPGDLTIELTYTLSEHNEISIEYHASTSTSALVNLTHHSYFNLDGHQNTIADQLLFVNSDKTLETTPENIPTGRFVDLSTHPFDFRTPKICPLQIDNTFVLDTETQLAASLFNPKNNLKLEVYTNQPGLHIYVGGNCFNILKGKGNADYHAHSGICFETQNFPDAPNHVHFPNSILRHGETYQQRSTYKFLTATP
jgi:aldose 1-epimerase